MKTFRKCYPVNVGNHYLHRLNLVITSNYSSTFTDFYNKNNCVFLSLVSIQAIVSGLYEPEVIDLTVQIFALNLL